MFYCRKLSTMVALFLYCTHTILCHIPVYYTLLVQNADIKRYEFTSFNEESTGIKICIYQT